MKYLQKKLLPFLFKHVLAFLCIAGTTLILKVFEKNLQIQIISLLFLLPVMISTVLWGLTPGILAGLFAFLGFNYYFIQPYHTLRVHQTQDLITLTIFLIVAVVMSQLIGQAREGVRLARQREWEATRMYELLSAIAGQQDVIGIANALAEHTFETLRLEKIEVWIEQEQGMPVSIEKEGNNLTDRDSPDIRISMKTARSLEGEIRLWRHLSELSEIEERLLETFAAQAALSIERVRLTRTQVKARLLEESDRLKSSLLNSVSHELRSPLSVIKASVSSLRSPLSIDWSSTARKELLATIEEETDHLNHLVGNLLNMSRIESGSLKPLKRWNSLAEIALGVANKMRKQLIGHALETDFPENLPLVPTDYVMIEQVYTNLISNSIKYAPINTPILLKARDESECLHAQVVNHSPPVPQEHLDRIFEKFYRVTQADQITGTGLGLSICKGIIEGHGGKIWAENGLNNFIFHFTLPLTLDGNLPLVPQEANDG